MLWHCWLRVRKSIRPVKIAWWGVSMVICLEWGQIVCIWSSWCHYHPKTPSSFVSFKSRLVYDTIRDAILTCARKPTWVGFIYSTETTTKNCKTEKLKSKSRYVRSNSKSLGNHEVSSEEEKERLQWKGFAEKEGFKLDVRRKSIVILT